jgi:hypothetical protein
MQLANLKIPTGRRAITQFRGPGLVQILVSHVLQCSLTNARFQMNQISTNLNRRKQIDMQYSTARSLLSFKVSYGTTNLPHMFSNTTLKEYFQNQGAS